MSLKPTIDSMGALFTPNIASPNILVTAPMSKATIGSPIRFWSDATKTGRTIPRKEPVPDHDQRA